MDGDSGRETVFVPRGWRWEPFTIYQLRSQHPGWDCVRAILEEGSIYQLIGDIPRPEDGIAAVTKLNPEPILFADDLPHRSPLELTSKLRELSPASKLVVVGEEPESELLAALSGAGLDALLPWRRLTPLGVFCCLTWPYPGWVHRNSWTVAGDQWQFLYNSGRACQLASYSGGAYTTNQSGAYTGDELYYSW